METGDGCGGEGTNLVRSLYACTPPDKPLPRPHPHLNLVKYALGGLSGVGWPICRTAAGLATTADDDSTASRFTLAFLLAAKAEVEYIYKQARRRGSWAQLCTLQMLAAPHRSRDEAEVGDSPP